MGAAWIQSSATRAAREQSAEVARQAIGADLDAREARLIEAALERQREAMAAEMRAYEQAHPAPLGRTPPDIVKRRAALPR